MDSKGTGITLGLGLLVAFIGYILFFGFGGWVFCDTFLHNFNHNNIYEFHLCETQRTPPLGGFLYFRCISHFPFSISSATFMIVLSMLP